MTQAEESPSPQESPRDKIPLEGVELARNCARIASFRRAADILVLDLTTLSPVTSYFVIATGTSNRQIRGIAEEIVKEVKGAGSIPFGVEGRQEARWVLIDLGDVVVHLMTEEARDFYDMEMLWGDAPRIDWESGDISGIP